MTRLLDRIALWLFLYSPVNSRLERISGRRVTSAMLNRRLNP